MTARMSRRGTWILGGALAAVLVCGALVLGFGAGDQGPGPIGPAERGEMARQLLSAVRVSASVTEIKLVAAGASADFGIEEGVRRVNIRVVGELALELRLESGRDIVLEGEPRACLVGPFWNPLDAGLSDKCWGDPNLQKVMAEQLATDAAGRPMVVGGQAIVLDAVLGRGHERCDYAPGEWHLEIRANPIIDGSAAGLMDVADIVLDVPFASSAALALLPPGDTRVCSYPAAVYNLQGEPRVSLP